MRPAANTRATALSGNMMTTGMQMGGLASGTRSLAITRATLTTGSFARVTYSGRAVSPDLESPSADQTVRALERDVRTRGVMGAAAGTTVSGRTDAAYA
jgi:hypothetical protein